MFYLLRVDVASPTEAPEDYIVAAELAKELVGVNIDGWEVTAVTPTVCHQSSGACER